MLLVALLPIPAYTLLLVALPTAPTALHSLPHCTLLQALNFKFMLLCYVMFMLLVALLPPPTALHSSPHCTLLQALKSKRHSTKHIIHCTCSATDCLAEQLLMYSPPLLKPTWHGGGDSRSETFALSPSLYVGLSGCLSQTAYACMK